MLEQLVHIDHSCFDFINQGLSNDFLDKIMPIVREKRTWIPLYIGLGIWLTLTKRKEGILLLAVAGLSVGMSDLISSQILKELFARTRPCLLPNFQEHIHLMVSKCSGAFSFPSSHAANHTALAVFLSLTAFKQKRLWQTLSISWAFLIGFAQIYVGVHFPTDILGGIILGAFIGMFNYKVFQVFKQKIIK